MPVHKSCLSNSRKVSCVVQSKSALQNEFDRMTNRYAVTYC